MENETIQSPVTRLRTNGEGVNYPVASAFEGISA